MDFSEVTQVIRGKRYNTAKATLIASDNFWDGSNFERRGTNTFLFRTAKGNYFSQFRTQWQGGNDGALTPRTKSEAKELYENLREKEADYETAFGEQAEEA